MLNGSIHPVHGPSSRAPFSFYSDPQFSFFLFADFCCHTDCDRPTNRQTERADGLIDHGCKKAVGKEGRRELGRGRRKVKAKSGTRIGRRFLVSL